MIDLHVAIRDFVMDDATILEQVGERVYAGRSVPPKGYKLGDGAAICFRIRGGSPDYDDALLTPSVQFQCYAASERAAWTLYRALYDRLHNGTGEDVLHGEAETLGQLLEEPETGWPFVLGFFSVMVRSE